MHLCHALKNDPAWTNSTFGGIHMIRSLSLASVLALGLAVPALATEKAADAGTDPAAVAAFTQSLSNSANAEQARKFLMAKGYTNVSELARDENGRWAGSAEKNGKKVGVAIDLTPRTLEVPATN